MKLSDYKKDFNGFFKQMTLGYLVRGDEVLMAMKKRGFGVGKWNGTGGKLQPGETVEEAMIREAGEELDIKPTSFHKIAEIKFYFTYNPDFNEICHVFMIDTWEGEPKESEEMAPKWFKIVDVPYREMWESDQIWLPKVMEGKAIKAEFLFGEGDKVLDYKILEPLG